MSAAKPAAVRQPGRRPQSQATSRPVGKQPVPALALPLSRQDLIAATVDLVSREGVGRVSMRRLAGMLGVSATALYYHCKDKRELLDLAAEVIVGQMRLDHEVDDWRDELRLLLLKQQTVLRSHPGIGRYLFDRRESAAALCWMNIFLDVLLRAGFDGAPTVRAFSHIVTHINPLFLIDEATEIDQSGIAPSELATVIKERPGEFAAVEHLFAHLAPVSFDDVFEFGVDPLIEMIAGELKAAKAVRPGAPHGRRKPAGGDARGPARRAGSTPIKR
jgi:AcrR family transcriptional regulator